MSDDDDEPSIWDGNKALIASVAVIGILLLLLLLLADRAGSPL